jgi:ADP-dependent NAD(P)H-hydrate dehydratase / NAD(P)H-hydrate epimerase
MKKILSAEQIKAADLFTIQKNKISSYELMEKASVKFLQEIISFIHGKPKIFVFAGSGNNGGDGLAIAHMLFEKGFDVNVYFIKVNHTISDDCSKNLQKIEKYREITDESEFPIIHAEDLIIDALLGIGCNKEVTGLLGDLIMHLNESTAKIFSVDIPSGLGSDKLFNEITTIQAYFTGTFQRAKLSFFLNESAMFVGKFSIIDIGLNENFINEQVSSYYYLVESDLKLAIHKRNRFSHKGHYGHALLIAGSIGKMGAAILASKACLHTGAGMLTTLVPDGYDHVLNATLPEAMTVSQVDLLNHSFNDLELFQAIGIGSGLGKSSESFELLRKIITESDKPLVIDADGLNLLALHPELLTFLPENSILTPHPKEFSRIVSTYNDSMERIQKAQEFAQKHKCILVVKDAITCVVDSSGEVFFNTTGNPAMAKAGSGDVLSGFILGLLSQGYSPLQAACLAVFFHGKAGDIAANQQGENHVLASDLIDYFRMNAG